MSCADQVLSKGLHIDVPAYQGGCTGQTTSQTYKFSTFPSPPPPYLNISGLSVTGMGYTDLALLMGQYPESAIYRRFSALNAENLLYLQAELVNLEKRYRKLKSTAVANDPEKINYDEDWYMLKHSGQAVPNDEVWTTFLEIRSKLKEYSESYETIGI